MGDVIGRVGRSKLSAVLFSTLLAFLVLMLVMQPATSAAVARVSVSPQEVAPGDTITITGRGFPTRARGSITFGGEKVGTFSTSRSGTFSKQWVVPAVAESGAVLAKVSRRQASANLQVNAPEPPPTDAERWSDAETWGGVVPQDGAEVTIPMDKTVLLDRDVALESLQVNGTLIFEDKDLNLSAEWIMVHGKLQIGTEDAPFQSDATISLTGTDKSQDVMNMGAKVIGVMGGTLEIHGQDRRSWTRLNRTAQVGADQLVLENASGWRRNDRIVVSSTDYDSGQAEEATITSVSGNTVTLNRSLDYAHWGTVQTYDGRPVDERAEVALLSRNVTIQGTDVGTNGFGGQIMVMSGGQAHIEGAELTKMGQKNVLRRYPLHFHMLGDAGNNSYLKDSTLHQTFNRCVVIHGTNNLNVSGNVCHDHLGHGFFMEDGAEHDNVIENNLGLTTKSLDFGERLLQSDGSAATFWITNPDNVVRNNVAAGSEGTGFWLAFPEHPTGLFAKTYPVETANTWPRRTPLGEFSGNVAHSTNGDGLHVDSGPIPDKVGEESGRTDSSYYNPRTNPTPPGENEDDSASVVANFTDFTAYKNRNRGVWLRGEHQQVTNSTLADNAIGATFANDETFLKDSLVVGETANKGTSEDWQIERDWVGLDGRSLPRYWEPDFPIRGFEYYDGRVGAENTTFVNFDSNDQRRASGLGMLLADAFSIHPENFATDLTFMNAERVYLPVYGEDADGNPAMLDGDRSAVFTDTDGSITGIAGSVVTADSAFLTTGSCTKNANWNAYVCPPGTRHATLYTEAVDEPGSIDPLTITREDGKEQMLRGCCDGSTDAITNLLPNRNYTVTFNGSTPEFTFAFYNTSPDTQTWVRLAISYPQTPSVLRYGCDMETGASWCRGKMTSLDALNSSTRSAYYYDEATDKLYLKLITKNGDTYDQLDVQPKQ